jgi:hypothetical protein
MVESVEVCLNRFPVRQLDNADKSVWSYAVSFEHPPEPETVYQMTGKILWAIRIPGARLGSSIVTNAALTPEQMQGDGWSLQLAGQQELDPANSRERKALEQLARRWLEQQLYRARSSKIERNSGKGLIWWNAERVEQSGNGWQIHSGVHLDVVVDPTGFLYLEIDRHYRFYTPWTLQEWLDSYPETPIDYVRNTYDQNSWRLVGISDESPEEVLIPELGISLAEYHRQKDATEVEIDNSLVVYVRSSKRGRQNKEVAHLSCRLRPSISMEVLSYLAEQNQPDAARVFNSVRQSIGDRLTKGAEVVEWLLRNIYRVEVKNVKPQTVQGFRFTKEALLVEQGTVSRPEAVIQRGCLRTGELRFGCIDLVGTGEWPTPVRQQLLSVARANRVTLDLETVKQQQDLPDRNLARQQFWTRLAQEKVRTVLVVTKWLGSEEKIRLRGEALRAGIALQFMLPMTRPDRYRAANVTLGLLVKAGWQPVGVKMPDHPKVAELTIGFDAGTNRELFYGTSAFAVLADGQSLGWELPEAQSGERFSGGAIWQAVLSIVGRFEQMMQRKPRRILLLRDGFVRDNEFELTIDELEAEGIAVDLLEVHKSGAGRMAIAQPDQSYRDAPPGVAVSLPDNSFRLITTQSRAGGSARPLEVVKVHGDAPLALLATEVFRLSQFHPASGFIPSRLPMPLHYADRMIKEVQRLGQLGALYGVDRRKIFAA